MEKVEILITIHGLKPFIVMFNVQIMIIYVQVALFKNIPEILINIPATSVIMEKYISNLYIKFVYQKIIYVKIRMVTTVLSA